MFPFTYHFPRLWLEGYVSTYQNLRLIFSCGRGKPRGKRHDNWIPETATWQLIFVSQPAPRPLVSEDRSLLPGKVLGE